MLHLTFALAGALLLVLALGTSSSAFAQESLMNAQSGDAFYYRGTGGVPPR